MSYNRIRELVARVPLILFVIVTLLGIGIGLIVRYNPLDAGAFSIFSTLALVVGLYGSVYGIDFGSIHRNNRWLVVLLIVTIGVPLQILATGLAMWVVYPFGLSLLIAVAIDQIDPISVDTLLADKESMSEDAQSVLRVWASFDDPVTVIFGFTVLVPILAAQGLINVSNAETSIIVDSFFASLSLNVLPAVFIALICYNVDFPDKRISNAFGFRKFFDFKGELDDNNDDALTLQSWTFAQWFGSILLVVLLILAAITQSFLLAAFLGMVLRPPLGKLIEDIIPFIYYIIVALVGMALVTIGVTVQDVSLGIILGAIEYFMIQPLSTLVIFNGYPTDIFRLSYAQQNGLTTLLMGLVFQLLGLPVLQILLPAIITINLLNLIVNRYYSLKERALKAKNTSFSPEDLESSQIIQKVERNSGWGLRLFAVAFSLVLVILHYQEIIHITFAETMLPALTLFGLLYIGVRLGTLYRKRFARSHVTLVMLGATVITLLISLQVGVDYSSQTIRLGFALGGIVIFVLQPMIQMAIYEEDSVMNLYPTMFDIPDVIIPTVLAAVIAYNFSPAFGGEQLMPILIVATMMIVFTSLIINAIWRGKTQIKWIREPNPSAS